MLEKIPRTETESGANTDETDLVAAVSPDKVSLFFDSEETDEALLERLKMERNLYRLLNSSETPRHLSERVLSTVRGWGFSDYSFIRFNSVDIGESRLALMPIVVIASYPGNSGLRLLVTAGDIRVQHLARVYYALANLPTDMFSKLDGRYLLMTRTATDNYTVSTGQPGIDRALKLSTSDNDESQQYLITALANKIEGIGTTRFPALFRPSKRTIMNPRPLRLINALAQKDITLREAADLLHISPDTANKHIAAAKDALGTKSTAATIWEAVKQGLINDDGEDLRL